MKTLAIIALCFLFFTMTVPAHAALTPLVQCGTSTTGACTMCDIFKLFKRIIDYVAFTLVPIIAGLLILMAGFYILLGGASPEMVSTGRKMLTNTLIGVAIIYGSWMVTNFILISLAGQNPLTSSWFKIDCQYTAPPIPTGPPPGGGIDPLCSDPVALAAKYREPVIPQNDPRLDILMTCIRNKMGSSNLGEISTFDKSVRLCNLTRGKPICSLQCSHAINSCHYGGGRGTAGALAVDYGNQVNGDAIIRAANQCGATGIDARCENNAGIQKACTDPEATHVHVNHPECDKN